MPNFSIQVKKSLTIFLLSVIAVIVHGYQFAVSDQEIFIPYILKSADRSLFPGDELFNQSSAHLSFFYPLMGLLTKLIDIQIIFFVGYLIFQFAFFTGVYRLSKVLLRNERLALLSLLPFLLPKFIGGTATQTFDLFFGYRSVGLIFFIFYLSYLFEKKYLKSIVTASFGVLFHPLSIVPNILIVPVLLIRDSKEKTQTFLKMVLLSGLFGVLVYIVLGRNYIFDVLSIDQSWYRVIMLRDNYVFPSTWTFLGWAAFFLYPALIFLSAQNLAKETKKKVQTVTVISLCIFLANVILVGILKLPSFAQFQLVRSIAPIAYVGLSLSPLMLKYNNKILKLSGYLAFISLCLNLFYLFLIAVIVFSAGLYLVKNKRNNTFTNQTLLLTSILIILTYICLNFQSYISLNNKIQFPKKEDDWISLQKWVLQNTDKSAKFLVPPDKTGFRLFSHRPIVGDIKDGAVIIYDFNYAIYWQKLMLDIKNYDNLSEIQFMEIRKKYTFEYVVSLNDKMNFKKIYSNNIYSIYILP